MTARCPRRATGVSLDNVLVNGTYNGAPLSPGNALTVVLIQYLKYPLEKVQGSAASTINPHVVPVVLPVLYAFTPSHKLLELLSSLQLTN